MPSRQKSMIDLREPFWDGPRHKVHPVQIGRIPPGGGAATQPPRGGGGPMPGLVRSATEHDIRLRSRRPGPGIEPRPVPPHFHELPPHIRQHMVRLHFMIQRTIYHFARSFQVGIFIRLLDQLEEPNLLKRKLGARHDL